MTPEILISKGIGSYHFFCDKPIQQRPARKDKMLIGGRHLIFYKPEKVILSNTFIYNTKK